MSRVDYQVEGREAHRYDWGDGSFLRVELYEDFFSMGWSCALPLAVVLERIEPVLANLRASRGVVFNDIDREHVELDADIAVEILRASEGPWSFARLELPSMTLVWQQADARAENEMNRLEGDEPAGSGEFGFMTSVFDADILANIVRQTATQPVSERATELIREITYVTEYVRPGHLTAR